MERYRAAPGGLREGIRCGHPYSRGGKQQQQTALRVTPLVFRGSLHWVLLVSQLELRQSSEQRAQV